MRTELAIMLNWVIPTQDLRKEPLICLNAEGFAENHI